MLAALGAHRFDVTHDAVVLATTTVADAARPAATAAGWTAAPDAVLVVADHEPAHVVAAAVRAWSEVVDVPITVRAADPAAAAAALDAGSAAVHDPSGRTDPRYLEPVASAGASVVVTCPVSMPPDTAARVHHLLAAAERARTAGVPGGSVIVDVTRGSAADPAAVRFLDELPEVAAAGWPVMVTVAASRAGPGDAVAVAAAHAVVVPRGARLLPTSDVRTTRRVARVTAELLRARDAGVAR